MPTHRVRLLPQTELPGVLNLNIKANANNIPQGLFNPVGARLKQDNGFGTEKPPLTTWEVVSQAQLAELLEPNLLYELGFYYNEISGIGDRYVRYAKFTEAEVLPLQATGCAAFYDESGDRMLPRFEAHMERLREYHMMSTEMVKWAEYLRERVVLVDASDIICRSVQGVTPM